MLIKLRGLDSIALTERCSDILDFMNSVGNKEKMASHISRCRACQKVALDTVRALSSAGIPDVNPITCESVSSNTASGNKEELQLIVTGSNAGIEKINGAEFVIKGKRREAETVIDFFGCKMRINFEYENSVFVIKILSDSDSDTAAVLRNDFGEPVRPPVKFKKNVSWCSVQPGEYALVLAGNKGSIRIKVLLNKINN